MTQRETDQSCILFY